MNTLEQIQQLEIELEILEIQWNLVVAKLQKEFNDGLNDENIRLIDKRSNIKNQILELKSIPELGKFANEVLFTDVNPYEIVKVVSDKTLEIRSMNAEIDPEWEPEFYVGGFGGNCANQNTQKYSYTSNLDAPVIRIRKRKDGTWGKGSINYSIDTKPVKFYDYNF